MWVQCQGSKLVNLRFELTIIVPDYRFKINHSITWHSLYHQSEGCHLALNCFASALSHCFYPNITVNDGTHDITIGQGSIIFQVLCEHYCAQSLHLII